MERKQEERACTCGRLPEMAPLANPYVPFQLENPPIYDSRKALVRGTLFPGLDLPFKGMVNKNEKAVTPLTELQVMAFAIQELALYLDTHRDDREALEMYQAYQRLYQEAVQAYNRKCGPMNHRMPSEGPYRWLDDPWPWEYAKNKEG